MISLPKPGLVSVRNVGPFDLGRLARLHRGCFEEAWSRSDLAHLLAMPGAFGQVARLYEGAWPGSTGCAAWASPSAGSPSTRPSCSPSG
jgi:ribosomal-protein-alanine N-acetyltransferase